MGETAQGLPAGADAVGEDLADEDPDDRALAEGVRDDEEHEACQDDDAAGSRGRRDVRGDSVVRLDGFHHGGKRAAVGVEGPGGAAQAGDVADRSGQHQLAAAEAIDERQAQHGEDEVHDAQHDRQEHGLAGSAPAILKMAGV